MHSGATFIFQNSDMSRTQAKHVWSGLERGIEEIQNGNASTLRFEELYRNAYTLVLHKHGELLYTGVEQTICKKLFQTAQLMVHTTDNQLIHIIVEQWNKHKLTMTMIRDILMYMDKTYCEIKKKVCSYELGILHFKKHVILNNKVMIRLRNELLYNIRKERDNEQIDQSLIRNVLRMFVDLDIPSIPSHSNSELYDNEFEKYFIRETREYYQIESEIYITQNSVPEYLQKIEQRLYQERQRADSYIPKKNTRDLLLQTCEDELIARYINVLVENGESGCVNLFEHESIFDLKRMFRLFARIDENVIILQNAMFEYVKKSGESIICDVENLRNPEKFVTMVLNLRRSMHKIVMKSFGAKKQFQRKLKEAFEHFINLDVRAAQYLSLYTDALLRKHASKLTEDEVLVKLDDVITIFKYLSDKDIFEDFYKQHLASRLLHTKSHSDHFEKCMIAKLKTECGHQYTSKLEGMFKDIAQSRVIHENWMQFHSNFGNSNNSSKMEMDDEIKSDDGGIELNAKVLTTGFWPNPKKVRCNLPSQIIEKCELFRDFYCSKHSGKKLMFDPSKGSAELRVMFDAAPKDLVVHTYQMCILLLFNERDTFSWLEIKERLQIEECELERHILAFAHPKVRILLKKPNKKSLTDVDTFTFNRKYKNQRVRVIVGVLDKRKVKKDGKNLGINGCEVDENGRGIVPQQVLEARKNRVEAAIVRIMKARKKLIHQQLIVEVVHQLKSRFNPNPQFIKQRIASLIEREYLERDAKDRRLYHYLA